MKSYRIRGIVLRSRVMREADRLLMLFTYERGKIKAVAYGAAKPQSKKRGAVQPFTVASLLLDAGQEMDVVRQAEEVAVFPGLHADLALLSYAASACELVELLCPEGQPNHGVYDLLLLYLRLLPAKERRPLVLAFTAKLLALTGFRPLLDACAHCGKLLSAGPFSLKLGGLLCSNCRSRDPDALPCSPGTVRLLNSLTGWPLERLGSLKVSPSMLDELGALLHSYLCFTLEREPRSLAFLRKIGE